jgi:2-aminophenol/2-amino-5-chlorophenol 1,6-dioxygenase alpha subunit
VADGAIVGAALVPGFPHLLAGQPAPSWARLADAVRSIGECARQTGADTLAVISTQWFTVLGHQFQLHPNPHGRHVDENWYPFDYGRLEYDYRTDTALVHEWIDRTDQAGLQARPTNYEGFPIDTGLIVLNQLLNADKRYEVAQVSCNLYAGIEDIEVLGQTLASAATSTGRRVFAIAVTALSSHLIQRWITPEEDAIERRFEQWDRRALDLLTAGDVDGLMAIRDDYARQAEVDSQLRVLGFLRGTGALTRPATLLEYGPIWGTGAAVLNWTERK